MVFYAQSTGAVISGRPVRGREEKKKEKKKKSHPPPPDPPTPTNIKERKKINSVARPRPDVTSLISEPTGPDPQKSRTLVVRGHFKVVA